MKEKKEKYSISAVQVQKYYELLKEIHSIKVIKAGALNKLIKQHRCSASTSAILVTGGIMTKKDYVYTWASNVCNIGTARELVVRLRAYNKKSTESLKARKPDTKAKENIKAHKELAEWALINSMPKAMPKAKAAKRMSKSNLQSEISFMWGLYSKKVYK
jgi:hypothetical protein